MVAPSRQAEDCNDPRGIFIDDASLIARHVVGLETLSPAQLRAADVTGLGAPSSFEAALIARWIVCLNDPPSQTGQWKFTPSSRTYESITSDLANQDYNAAYGRRKWRLVAGSHVNA